MTQNGRLWRVKFPSGFSYLQAEAHELERAQRKIKRHQKFSGVEDVTLMEDVEVSKDVQARRVMHEKDVNANSLSSSDIDSSSVGSFDDSTSEEEKVSTGFRSGRVVKQEVTRPMEQPRRLPQFAGDSLVFPLRYVSQIDLYDCLILSRRGF